MTMRNRPAIEINGDPIANEFTNSLDDIDPNDTSNIPEGPTVVAPQFNVRRVDSVVEDAEAPSETTAKASERINETAPRIDDLKRVTGPSTGSGYVRRPKLDWAAGAEKRAAEIEAQLKAQNDAEVERQSGNQGLKRLRELEDKVAWMETNLISLMQKVEEQISATQS